MSWSLQLGGGPKGWVSAVLLRECKGGKRRDKAGGFLLFAELFVNSELLWEVMGGP